MNKETTKMIPGDELHLTMLMAPYSLNLVTGKDRQRLLAFGRAAFDAGIITCQATPCLHQIAEPAQAARTEFEAVSRFMKCEWNLDWDPAGFYDDAKTDAAFTWFEQGYMRAQQAAAPQALQAAVPEYSPNNPAPLRREGESIRDYRLRCGWDHHARPAEGVPAQEVMQEELAQLGYRFKDGRMLPPDHVGELLAVVQAAPCSCQFGTCETASDRQCRMKSEIAATQPAAQWVEQDAARWRMSYLISKEVLIHPDKRAATEAVAAYMRAVHAGYDLQAAIDAAIAAQAKQGGASNDAS